MKKKNIILILICVVVTLLALGIGRKWLPISEEENKLISSCNHIDNNIDMVCDSCASSLPFSNYVEYKNIESIATSTNQKVQITGMLPKKASAVISNVEKDEAVSLAKKYKEDISAEDVIQAFDISIETENTKYQPKEYGQKVKVTLSNLDLNLEIGDSKEYALMHIIDEENYEILPIDKVTKEEIEFTADSFSTYIIITVGVNKLTFDGENFKVLDDDGNEITNDATVLDGTSFNFTIVPEDMYGIVDVTATLASGDSGIRVVGSGVKGRECNISNLNEDLTVYVTTAIAPTIITQPVSATAKIGESVTYTIVAENVTTYQWQYSVKGDRYYWKNADSTSNSITIPFDLMMDEFVYRCLLGNDYFVDDERVVSDMATTYVIEDEFYIQNEAFGIEFIKQPQTQKILLGETATFEVVATLATTYQWQYKSGDENWLDVDSTIGTGYDTAKLTIDTSSMTEESNLSGLQFRCVISNSEVPDFKQFSDIAILSIAQGVEEVSVYADMGPESLLMERDHVDYMLGAYRANKTTYKAELATKVVFSRTAPDSYVTWWDVSANQGDNIIKSYVARSESSGDVQYYTQYIVYSGVITTTNAGSLFEGYEAATAIDNISYLKVNDSISFYAMFADMWALQSLDLTSFNVNNATDFSFMFYRCHALKNLIFGSRFNATKATNFKAMFYWCTSLESVDLSTFNTPNLTNMESMFWDCDLLKSITFGPNFNTSNVTTMFQTFIDCSALESLDLSMFNTISLENTRAMFQRCSALTSINFGYNFDTSNVEDMSCMFSTCSSLPSINFGNKFYTTSATDMSSMFDDCSSLQNLDLSLFNTSSVEDMEFMFAGCSALESLELGENFYTNKINSTYRMFYNCASLTELDLGTHFDTTSVTEMFDMFAHCSSLKTIDVSKFNTSQVTRFDSMFNGCSDLTEIDVSGFDTSSANTIALMFQNCSSLKNINLCSFSTASLDGTTGLYKWNSDGAKCVDVDGLFNGCSSLESICLGENFDRLDGRNMFYGNSNLKSLISQKKPTSDSTLLSYSANNNLANLSNAIFYVHNTVVEDLYEDNTTYLNALTADRIKPILGVNGLNPVTVPQNATYTDMGATVAGYTEDNIDLINSWRYTISKSGLPVDTSTLGTKTVMYTLNFKNTANTTSTLMTATRDVNVEDLPVLMIREGYYNENDIRNIMLGAYRAGKEHYTSDLVSKVIFTNTVPEGATDSWDVSYNSGDGQIISYIVPSTEIPGRYEQYIFAERKINASSCYKLFSKYENMTEIENIDYFITTGVTSMEWMFWCCDSLTNLDVTYLDTSEVRNMQRMFSGCRGLTSLNVSNFDTSKVTSMSFMFSHCISLLSLDVTNFNTSKVTNMSGMFDNCFSLTNLDVTHFDTSKVTDMSWMFSGCKALTELDLTNFNTSNVENMSYMFQNCEFTSLDVTNFNTSKVTDMSGMFSACIQLINLDVTNFDTSNVTDMKEIFNFCFSLTNLDVTNFDTSNVTDMSSMFAACETLTNLDVSKFDTSQVKDMRCMFDSCETLTNLDVSKFDTSQVTDMSHMFCDCQNLTTLDLRSFDTSQVTDMKWMFNSCETLTNLDVSKFDTSQVTDMSYMFSDCKHLIEIILSENFDKIDGLKMFSGCMNLYRIISVYKPTSSGDIMKISEDNYLGEYSSHRLYVPNATIEGYYEENETYMSLLDSGRIKTIMEISGDNPTSVKLGNTYEDAGITVAGWTAAESGEYTSLGFTTETLGLPVDTSTKGEKEVTYKLSYKSNSGDTTLLDTQVRTVKVTGAPQLMSRELNASGDANYMLGAYRAGKEEYTSDKVVKLEFATTEPDGWTDSWDVSYNEGDNQITSYIVPSGDGTGEYKQYIVCESPIKALYGEKLFMNYSKIENVDNLAHVDFSEATSFKAMFYGCARIHDLDITSMDTSSATDMSYMFYEAGFVNDLDVTNMTTDNVTDMSYMFYNSGYINNLDVTNWNTSNVTNMSYMFYGFEGFGNYYMKNFENLDTSNVTDMSYMFANGASVTSTSLNISGFDTKKVTNMEGMFKGFSTENIIFGNDFDTSNVENMSYMFELYMGNEPLDLKKFNTSKVTTMKGMFNVCFQEKLDLSSFDTGNVIDMSEMFAECFMLNELNVSNFNTQNVIDMSKMFMSSSYLESLDLSSFDTSKVESMKQMFYGCSSLKKADLGNFNTPQVKDTSNMFGYCSDLELIDLSGFDTTSTETEGGTIDNMFYNCKALKTLILGEKFERLDGSNTFKYCDNLERLITLKKVTSDDETLAWPQNSHLISCGKIHIYVPDEVSDVVYDANVLGEMLTQLYGEDRIKPIMELSGDNPTSVILGNTYEDAGITVAGWTSAESAEYTSLGFATETIGLPLDTSIKGEKEVTYKLSYKQKNSDTRLIDTQIRTVKVVKLSELMKREAVGNSNEAASYKYMLGAYRANKTQYTADLVTKIIFTDKKPSNVVDSWDVSFDSGDNDVISYIVPSTVSGTGVQYYDQYIVAEGNIKLISGRYFFSGYSKMTSIDGIEKLNTSSVQNMSVMFCNCSALKTLEFGESFDTSNVYNMEGMFAGCSGLNSLDVSKFNTSAVTNMSSMFINCSNLTSLDLNNFNTSAVISMWSMFSNCSSLTNLDVSSFNTSVVTNMNYMFSDCSKLTSLDLSNFNTSAVTDMASMFSSCSSLTNLDVSSFNTSAVISMSSMFSSCSNLTSLDVSKFNTSVVTSMSSMFSNCSVLKVLNLSNFNTSAVTNMSSMFSNCRSLIDLDVGNFNTSAVTDMNYMFSDCNSLTNLDVSSFNTSDVTNMKYMFSDCSSLTNLDVSNFNTSAVTSMLSMFSNCSSLTNLDVSSFNTSVVTNMNYMFSDCSKLTSLDLSNFNTSAVTNMRSMFSDCVHLIEIILSENFDKIDGLKMFYGCRELTRIISVYKPTSSGDIMKISEDNYLGEYSSHRLYVPNATIEGYYEENETYMSLLGSDRIKPIMELSGDNPTAVGLNRVYNDAGVTVASWSNDESGDYISRGFSLMTEGMPVDTSVEGFNEVTYTLKYTNSLGDMITLDTQTRMVEVIEGAVLMQREAPSLIDGTQKYYAIGAIRENKMAYTADKIRTITLVNTSEVPVDAIDSWDVSYVRGSMQVMAWVKQNSQDTTKYDLYIGANGGMMAPENCTSLFSAHSNCDSLTGLEWLNTSRVTNMQSMFSGNNYTELNLEGFDTSKVTNMQSMFAGSYRLANLDISNFDTSFVNDFSMMIAGSTLLINVELPVIKNTADINFYQMFGGASSVKNIKLESLDEISNANMDSMFAGATRTSLVDFSGLKIKNITQMSNMFAGVIDLKTVILGEQFPSISGQMILGGTFSFERLISMRKVTESSEMMDISASSGFGMPYTEILYVPDKLSESIYEADEIYASQFGTSRIETMLKLVGEETINIYQGDTYTDLGVEVFGWSEDESLYNDIGFTLTTLNANVDTRNVGTTEITYVLNHVGNLGDPREVTRITRTVNVKALPTVPTIMVKQGTTEITSGNWANGELTVTLSGSTYADGELEYVYSTDGTNWNVGNTFTFNTETLSTVIHAKARDKENNDITSSEATFEIKLDRRKPNITSYTTIRHEGVNDVIGLEIDDGTISSGIVSYATSSENDITKATWQSENEFVIPNDGTWYAWAKDAAGNVSDVYEFKTTEKYKVEATYGDTVELYPDVEDALDTLKEKGVMNAALKLLEDNSGIAMLKVYEGSEIILDMNGKKLISTCNDILVSGKLTIINNSENEAYITRNDLLYNDSFEESLYDTVIIINGELTVDGNIKIYGELPYEGEGELIFVSNNGMLNLNQGTIEGFEEYETILNNGTTTITGGTITSASTTKSLIVNNGTLNFGINDSSVSVNTPRLEAAYSVIDNNGTLNFYDGRLVSINKTVILDGAVTTMPSGYHLVEEETDTTKEMYLESNDEWIEYWDISETPEVDNVYAGIQVVQGDGISDDTRYKLVVGGTGKAKDFEVVYGIVGTTTDDGNHPWYDNYKDTIVELELREGVTKYGVYMFFNLDSVTSISLPKSLLELGDYACESMNGLSGNVEIHEDLTNIGVNPFKKTNVETFTVNANNTAYVVQDEGLYDVDKKELVSYPCGSLTEEGIVTEGTLIIGKYAFMGANNLKTVILPETLQTIDGGAFEQSFGIEEITIPEGVTTISWRAFCHASSLKNVYLKTKQFTEFSTNVTFYGLAQDSIIYTESKEIADLFEADVTHTAAKTQIYYPFKILTTLENAEIKRGTTLTLGEVELREGYIANDVVYQWYKDGVAIPEATSLTYTKSNFTDADEGVYKLVVQSALQENGEYYYTIESNEVTISMGDFDAPEEVNTSVEYNEDGSATVIITARDSETGVDEILVDGENIEVEKDEERGSAIGTFDITEGGDYIIEVKDYEDNTTTVTITAYEIHYMPNTTPYEGETKYQIKIKDVDIRLRTNGFRKVGHGFTSWNTNEQGTGTRYDANAWYTGNANTTLYAMWNVLEYVVRFYNDNGINGIQLVSEATYPYGATITVPDEQFKTATSIEGDKYRIYYHNNNWIGEKEDLTSTENVVTITKNNKENIRMIDSNINYYATYTYQEFDTTNATLKIDGKSSITGNVVGIENIEGLVILGQNSTDTSKPTITGDISLNNKNGIVLWYNAGFVGPTKGLIVKK